MIDTYCANFGFIRLIYEKVSIMSDAAAKSRIDPELKELIAKRVSELVKSTGLDPDVVSFRCGWKSRSRLLNYMSGHRTPGIPELMQLDKTLEPILGPYASFYILYGKSINDAESDPLANDLPVSVATRSLRDLISGYVEMNRIKVEPKLTLSKMIEDFLALCKRR